MTILDVIKDFFESVGLSLGENPIVPVLLIVLIIIVIWRTR